MARVVPAVARALDILELFLEHETVSAPDIASRLDLPRTTVHELVATLVDRSYLVPVPGQRTGYRLGMRLFQLGGFFAARIDLVREAQAVAGDIAAECDETVHVAVLDGIDVVYIAKVDSTHPVRMVSAVGRRLPAHCTGVGKMLLSAMPPAELADRFPADGRLSVMTSNSIASLSRLRDHLAEVRARGIAYDDCESNEAVHCVAAPVLDHAGVMVAAMSVSIPTPRWDESQRESSSALVRRGATMLSARLGYQPEPTVTIAAPLAVDADAATRR